jgi:RNA recognition motif-containing protein
MELYISNLSGEITAEVLRTLFGRFGKVDSAVIVRDRRTSQSKGLAIVVMPTPREAERAVANLDGKQLKGQAVVVSKTPLRAR